MACIGRCIVALVAFMWLFKTVSIFLEAFNICIPQTKIINFRILLHCRCVVCFALNWVKYYYWLLVSNNISFSMTYFHFLNWFGGRKDMRQISCKDCQHRKNEINSICLGFCLSMKVLRCRWLKVVRLHTLNCTLGGGVGREGWCPPAIKTIRDNFRTLEIWI